ncbi:MAG: O-antigen ligase family protein [Elusimicrobia bacterium]|nr:O-antigen ligase family protein [Elusimicrobiota bacterium]
MSNQKTTRLDTAISSMEALLFCRKAIYWWLPILYLLISSAFYLRTYDSAQVKITLVQMGGLCLIALYVCRLLEEGALAFSKDDLVCLAPFLAYLGYGIVSFLHAPYHWSSTDFFIRRLFYMTVPLIVVQEFTQPAVSRLTRILIWSTWITVGYGVLQWFDYHFFPTGVGNGIDPFIWRGAFGDRVFSTYGNPNFFADYLVIMLPVLICQFLKTGKISLVVLIVLDLFDLYGAQTKGAWIGGAISTTVLLGTYFYFFQYEKLRQHRVTIGAVILSVLMATMGAVAFKLRSSFTSVNFRLFTWEATWEMIMTKPVLGTGLGSFWVIYPAFRRPPIFHIEGKHNTETDHAEDEYLEVLFDEGIAGFGIFLWLIVSTFVVAYRSLAQMTGSLKKGERAPPRAYDLMGFLVAFQGMLAHNFFDVSLRFVSSGVYLGLLSGLVVNLSRGVALSELHRRDAPAGGGSSAAPAAEGQGILESLAAFFIWPLRFAAWGGLLYSASKLTGLPRASLGFSGFDELQGPLAAVRASGEVLQWHVAWICYMGCVVGLGGAFARIVYLTRNPLVPAAVLAVLFPLHLVFGFFRADVYHNIAIFFSKQQQWDRALQYYFKVGELNPAFVMSFYFRGNVYNDRFNMTKVYNPAWGDANNVARDDFERAMGAYDEVKKRAPNYVQMHHQVGVLWMKLGGWLLQQGRIEEGQKAWNKALENFEMYRNIDPVFAPNYYRMGHIYMMRKQYDKAIAAYLGLLEADRCAVSKSLSNREWLRGTILAYQSYVQDEGGWVHKHETADAYASLGTAHMLRNGPGDATMAAKAFDHALKLDPNNETAKRNIRALHHDKLEAPVPPVMLQPPAASPFELPKRFSTESESIKR